MIFDLDPSPKNSFKEVVNTALTFKKLFEELELRTYIKTSGATGLHIYLPVINKYTYEEIRNFARCIAKIISDTMPEITTIERIVEQRGDKIYLDYMQNVARKTICAPYSVRPRDGATVSTPVKWEELDKILPGDFNIKTIFDRLNKAGDLFHPTLLDQQDLDRTMKYLGVFS